MDSDSDSYSSHNKPTTDHPQKHQHQHHQPSNSDLMSSAKFLAETAKYTLHNETDKVDTGKAAGAAADLLEAASHYGKLEEKSFGNYIEKAENYLHQYHSSHSTTTTTTTDSGHHPSTTTTTTTTHSSSYSDGDNTTHSSSHSEDGDDQSGGGYGEYFKMAQGFLKKY